LKSIKKLLDGLQDDEVVLFEHDWWLKMVVWKQKISINAINYPNNQILIIFQIEKSYNKGKLSY
jgi:hypothetical protein